VITSTLVVSQSTSTFQYWATVDQDRTAGEILNQFSYSVDSGETLFTDPVTVTVHSPLSNSVKTVDKDTANVDDTLLYTINLNNETTAQDVTATVVDTIPDYTSFITGSQGVADDDGQISWSGPVTAGESVEVTFTVKVTSRVPQYPTPIVNIATVDDGLNPEFDLAPVTTTVESKVGMAKTVDLLTAFPGSVLQYTIQVTPTGDSFAQVSDPIPANTTIVTSSVSSPGVYEDGHVKFLALVPETVTFEVTVDSPLGSPAEIINTAYITDETDTMSTEQATTAIASPLEVGKSGLDPADAGARMSWQISMTNQSALTTTASLTDVLPDEVQWITITEVVSDTGSAGFASGVFTWTGEIGPLSSVHVTFPVTVVMGLENGTPITNEARIDDSVGNILTATGSVTVSSAVDLSTSSKDASEDEPLPEETVVYTITLTNDGNMDAAGITVTDTVPANMTYVPDSASDGGSWDGTTLTWSGLAVVAGDSMDITFEAMVDDGVAAGTSIINTAWISQSTLAEAETPSEAVTVGEQPILVASKSVEPAMPTAGERLTYTIQVANTGNVTMTEVSVTDPIPDDTTYVPGSVTGGADELLNVIQLTDATLGPAESLTVTFAVTVDIAARITNTAYITGAGTLLEATAITYPAGPLHHIVVSPTAVTLAAGGTQQFTATGYDVDDNIVPDFTPAWSVADADAGTIDASGVFTASTIGGYYPATVVAAADSIVGTADVTVEWSNEVFLPLVMKNAP
jgi:uncharacterized repeat protein (TIGR01451 family)